MKTIFIAFMFLLIGCSFQSDATDFTQEEIDYFIEIALGAEFGNETPVIKKWTNDIRIKINGDPTEADRQTINNIVNDLNELITVIKIKLVEKNENLVIAFSPESEFSSIDPNYVPTNYGFFWALWHDDNFVIYDTSILISSAKITQKERSHLIREELTQSLGLMNDSNKYKNSVFYQEWTDVTDFSEIDKSIIKLLYQKKVKPGMSKEQVLKVLN
ncbi:DUF2927 domain-containing protein [bacterium]|nr:DUF2927 domain-containing protein [bacterium]